MVKAANVVLVCIRSVASRSKDLILPLNTGKVAPGVLHAFLCSPVQVRDGPTGKSPLKGHKVDRARLFSVVFGDRWGNGHRLNHTRRCLSIRKHFFTLSATEHWTSLPREVVRFPSLEIFKSYPYMILGNQLLEQGGWTIWLPKVPPNLNHSVTNRRLIPVLLLVTLLSLTTSSVLFLLYYDCVYVLEFCLEVTATASHLTCRIGLFWKHRISKVAVQKQGLCGMGKGVLPE